MTKILELIGIIGGIIPIILSLIKEFETPGFGKEKKEVVLKVIGNIYDAINITVITKEKLLGIAGNVIDIAIAFFNVVGWFKHKNPTVSS